jgi:hypothetical protein
MKRSYNKRKKPLAGATANGENQQTLEDINKVSSGSLSVQELKQEIEFLAEAIAGIEDDRVYLLCDDVQKVRVGYRVKLPDIFDVRRAKQ